MIDIVFFEGDKFDLGFSEVLNCKNFKIVEGGKDNRKLAENKKIDILLNPEKGSKKDNLHYKNSGLDQVVCKLANRNKIAIGFSFSEFLNSNNRSELLGRMTQNVKLCRKYKVKIVVASFAKNKYEMRDIKDLLAFCRVIGMTGKEANDALNFRKKEEDIKEI
jgi:ribonuclease P/MRP protein subunit RPP1